LLQNRDANLDVAADMLGFSSNSAFSRWFLSAFGKRPSEWRKELDFPS
jgi:AraC-like DNA-binding protein